MAPSLRILIVDDHVDFTDALCVLFSVLGQELRAARTATEALHLVRECTPDMMLIDIGLPDIDGYELARRLRRAHGKDPYIVAITGWCREEDRARALAAGYDLHLPKPLDVEAVRVAILAARARTARLAAARLSEARTTHH